MRSRHADHFNHDDDASGYDDDVRREEHPIRAGYARLLDWVAQRAEVGADARVLELGIGTANLTLRLPRCARVVGVDISERMLELARTKLASAPHVELLRSDLLECLDRVEGPFDVVVSTYALHHLTDDEKDVLLAALGDVLVPGGLAVIGDLMFADGGERAAFLAAARADGRAELARDIEDEFFWDIARARGVLEGAGWSVEAERFSELSWGLLTRRPA